MEIKYLSIKNFKSIRHMEISDIQNALILVGKNNTGKSSILHALRAVEGSYEISLDDFNETMQNIEIGFILSITEEDLHIFHKNGMVSQYKKYDLWKKDFEESSFHLTKMKRSPLRSLLIKKANSGFTMVRRSIISIFERFSQSFISLERTVI